jgi:hypothetical protein
MIYTAIDTFYLTDEQLRDSPSRKDGIDEATETASTAATSSRRAASSSACIPFSPPRLTLCSFQIRWLGPLLGFAD